MTFGYIAHAPANEFAFGRTRRTEIHYFQCILALRQQVPSALYIAPDIIAVLIAHQKAHDIEQVGRMNRLSRCIPRRQHMAQIRKNTIYDRLVVHFGLKITKQTNE